MGVVKHHDSSVNLADSLVYSRFMQAKGPDGDFVKLEDVKTESLAILIATFDTTAAFICAFVDHMIENPGAMTKLVAEIQEFQSQGRITSPVVSLDETGDMPFFMACVNENAASITFHTCHSPAYRL